MIYHCRSDLTDIPYIVITKADTHKKFRFKLFVGIFLMLRNKWECYIAKYP